MKPRKLFLSRSLTSLSLIPKELFQYEISVGVILRCKHQNIKYSLLFWSEREQIISHLERFPLGIEFWFKFGFASDWIRKHLIQY